MTDFVIMTKSFVILMPLSYDNDFNGLQMTMTVTAVMRLCHRHRHKFFSLQTLDLAGMRKGELPHTTFGGGRAFCARPPFVTSVPAVHHVTPRVCLTPHDGQNDRR